MTLDTAKLTEGFELGAKLVAVSEIEDSLSGDSLTLVFVRGNTNYSLNVCHPKGDPSRKGRLTVELSEGVGNLVNATPKYWQRYANAHLRDILIGEGAKGNVVYLEWVGDTPRHTNYTMIKAGERGQLRVIFLSEMGV